MLTSNARLNGMRVLIVEDSFLIAEDIADVLRSRGCEVCGPHARIARALPSARGESLDGALLDVRLGEELCFPIAEVLEGRGVPFLFLSGYGGVEVLPSRFRRRPFVAKPFHEAELLALMCAGFAAGPSGRTRTSTRVYRRNLADRGHAAYAG